MLICTERGTICYQCSIVETYNYRGSGITLGGHSDLHVYYGGILTAVRHRDEILVPYSTTYASAIGDEFLVVDDNAQPHRVGLLMNILKIKLCSD